MCAAYDPSPLAGPAEQKVSRAVHEAFQMFFTQARRDILGAVTADASPADLPPNLDAWPHTNVWADLVERFILPAITVVFGDAFDAASRSDVLQARRYRSTFLERVTGRLSQALWPADAFETVRADLVQGVDEGESIPQLRSRVAAALQVDRFSYAAERIARTESHTAVEGGTWSAHMAWQEESGETLHHMWWATSDGRTRPEHAAAHGHIVPLAEPFTVGGAPLAYPGDPDGPAHLVISCRCTALTGTREELDAMAPVTAAGGNQMAEETDDPAGPPVAWRGVLAPLEVRGDFRVLAEPADQTVPTTDLMWLSYQEASGEGHDGKVTVGRVDRAWVHDGQLWGEGVFDTADETGTAQAVIRKIRDGFAGSVSIDLAEMDWEVRYYDEHGQPVTGEVDLDDIDTGRVQELVYVTDWRLGGATLVQDPAFHSGRDGKQSARIWIVEEAQGAVTAAATGDARLPLAPRDHEWDGPAALRRLAEAGLLNQGTFWRDDDADPDSDIQADYRLPFADLVDGELVAVPRGIFGVASVLQGGMGGVDLPEQAQDQIRDRVQDYYERMAEEFNDPSVRAPWDNNDDDDDGGDEAMAASAAPKKSWAEKVADAVPVHPPATWFTNPQLTGLTKVRVTDEGRVYGHIADWNQTHIGHTGQRVYPPRCPDRGAYPRFHRHPIRCEDGTRINTGPLTTAGHASTDAAVTMSAAMAHYDDPRFVAANVVCGEDEFGIWVAGALRPGIEAWQVAFVDTYSFSGDWRNGALVAACAVSVEGFFVPNDDSVHALAASAGVAPQVARVRSRVDDGEVVALVSAGVVAPTQGEARTLARHDMHRLLSAIDTGTTQVQALANEVESTVYAAVRKALADHQADQDAITALAADLELLGEGS